MCARSVLASRALLTAITVAAAACNRLGHGGHGVVQVHHTLVLPRRSGLPARVRRHLATECASFHPVATPLTSGAAGFVNARSWLQDVREHADPHLTCILVGNKVDLCADEPTDAPEDPSATEAAPQPAKRKRQVTTEEAEIWAKEEGLLFVETSAKSGLNVEMAFEQATRDILEKVRRGVFEEDRVSAIQLLRLSLMLNGFRSAGRQSPGVKLSQPRNDGLTLETAAPKSRCC